MVSRPSSKSAKSRFFFFCLFVIIALSIVYFYLMYAQENLKNMKWAEKRCLSELSSVKYQLEVVTDYKKHVEKMLSDSQRAHNLDKDKFKDVTESCITMKQQSLLCQNQFDDLQSECKKVREKYNKNKLDTEKLKEEIQEEVKLMDESKRTIDELFGEIDTLRRSNTILQDRLQIQNRMEDPPVFEDDDKPIIGKNFSQQYEISPGVYEVGKSTGITPQPAVKGKVTESNLKKNVNNLARSIDKSPNHVPPGFAPVLRVVESGESVNLQKPPDVAKENFAVDMAEERKVKKVEKSDDRDLELVGALPDVKINAILEDNDGVNAPMDHEKLQLLDDANNGREPNRQPQEDDDEGEEYSA